MCITPFVAAMSAAMTLELPLMMTPAEEDRTNTSSPCSVFTFCVAFRSLLNTAAPDTTWYVRMLTSLSLFLGSDKLSSVALGSLAKAALDGAKTVKGPLPCSAATRPPAFSAVTSVDRSLLPSASSTMFLLGPETAVVALAGAGGMSTVSMMCTTPFVAAMSAAITLELPLMVTPAEEDRTNTSSPCSVLTICVGFRSLLNTAAPDTTWYVRMPTSLSLFVGSNKLPSVALGSLANAALDGAKTVKGPLPCSAATRPPAFSAVTSVDRSLLPSASSTMFLLGPETAVVALVGAGGMSTVSMMCTTPFVAAMSAAMTLELRLMRTLLRGERCTLSMA